LENSNGDIAAAYRLIYSVFGSRMGFSGYGDNSFLTKFNRYVGDNNARLARGVIRLVTSKVFLVLIMRYVPNVAKRPKNVTVSIILTIDRLTTDRFFLWKFSNNDICATGHPIHFMFSFYCQVFWVRGSNVAISSWKNSVSMWEKTMREHVIGLVTIYTIFSVSV